MKLSRTMLTAICALTLPTLAVAQDAQQWQGGYAGLSQSWTEAVYSASPTLTNSTNAALSLYGGYHYAVSTNFVVGVELSYGVSAITEGGVVFPYDVQDNLELRIRGGYATGNYLVYAAVGTSKAEIGFSFGPPTFDTTGTSYAVGVERKVGEAMSVRAELSQYEFDTSDFFGPDSTATVDQISIGAAFHF
jgi:opacity protein-like surface antigen